MRTLKIGLIIGFLLTLLFFPAVSRAEKPLTAQQVIAGARLAFYYSGDDMKAKVLMELINKAGKKRIRELTILRKDEKAGGNQKYFIYFHKPFDVKGTTFMVYKYPGKDDDRWLFIPAINLVKQIAASDKYSSFVGSDFTYEDISGRKPEEDKHTLLKKEKLNQKSCLVIESVPLTASRYTRRVSWIEETTFLPLKEEFYDKQGELYRRFQILEVKNIDGIPTATKRVMDNLKTGHQTMVTFQQVAYHLGIGDNIFTERYMKKPPLKWIR